MTVRILGISAFYHDSAAALVVDGEIVAAAQEERFSRVKNDHRFPHEAAQFCLQSAGIDAGQLDYVCFYDKPLIKFERLLETYLAYAPRGYASFRRAMPLWLKQKLNIPAEIRRSLGLGAGQPILFTSHHESHAASAFYPSPFAEAALLTCDGVGEWDTTTWGVGNHHRIELRQRLAFPHSLGLLYSAFTYFAGFKVNSGEYKLMGLAPYGQPVYADIIRKELLDLKKDGSMHLNMKYFTFAHGLTMTGKAFARLFDGPARQPEAPITQREMDLAASIQVITEEWLLTTATYVHRQTGLPNLCMAGGVALNCVANGRLRRDGPFENIWVQPAAGDSGAALGAALFVWHQLLEQPRVPQPHDAQRGSFLGPAFSDDDVQQLLDTEDVIASHHADEAALLGSVAEHLANGQIVGWFHGRAEFGPRALGSRSILGDPRRTDMQSVMNLKIKFRESFRPFAPCVRADRAHEFFDMLPGQESPYMMFVAPVRADICHPAPARTDANADSDTNLITRVNVARSDLPAITHVDYSARVQTVDAVRHGRFYRLLRAFEERTGCPVLVNTSFNVRGEPIVNTPAQALACFLNTDMDVLVLNNYVITKEAQTAASSPAARQNYLQQFALD